MASKKFNRPQFFEQLDSLDEDRLKKALWNLYWRGSSAMRERIETELDPADRRSSRSVEPEPIDAHAALDAIREFATLARSGAYIAGDRRVAPKERTRWRFTFQRLASDAVRALGADDVDTGAAAVAELVDLAREMREFDYVRSDDPIEAARFVISDAVGAMWLAIRDRHGFGTFAKHAAPQLLQWESEYGWTRRGWGRVAEQETSLATVLATKFLSAIDMWTTFADRYIEALDDVVDPAPSSSRGRRRYVHRNKTERTGNLAEWHLMLLDRLVDSEQADRIVRLVVHTALAGPELTFFQAHVARRRGDIDAAHAEVTVVTPDDDLMTVCAEFRSTREQAGHALAQSSRRSRSRSRTQASGSGLCLGLAHHSLPPSLSPHSSGVSRASAATHSSAAASLIPCRVLLHDCDRPADGPVVALFACRTQQFMAERIPS